MVGKVGMVHAGEKLHLNCTATGIPKPDISWYRNKKKLQKSKNSRNFALELLVNLNWGWCEIHKPYADMRKKKIP